MAPSHLVVVDNHSEDGSAARIRSARPGVELIETGENLGYAGGMNAGLRRVLETGAAYVLVINSDTLVKSDTVGKLVSALDTHPAAGAATGTFFYHPETGKVWYAGGSLAYGLAHAVTNLIAPPPVTDGVADAHKVTFLTGCAILFRVSSLRTAGLFDERYFMYLEDAELSARFLSRGFDLLYVPGAVFYHRLDENVQTPLKTYFVTRNRLLFLETAPTWTKRLAGSVYAACALAGKSAGWFLTDHRMASALCMGVRDYWAGRWKAGRGLGLAAQQIADRGAHADRH
jgi:hypothetical protein